MLHKKTEVKVGEEKKKKESILKISQTWRIRWRGAETEGETFLLLGPQQNRSFIIIPTFDWRESWKIGIQQMNLYNFTPFPTRNWMTMTMMTVDRVKIRYTLTVTTTTPLTHSWILHSVLLTRTLTQSIVSTKNYLSFVLTFSLSQTLHSFIQ